jgi:hypothetical protein
MYGIRILDRLSRRKLTILAVPYLALLLSGFAGLLLFGCFAPVDTDSFRPRPSQTVQLKKEAAVNCNQEIDALWKSAANQDTKPCVKEKIVKPLSGICATDGLGRDCIFALDRGALCLPDGPTLPECNRLAKMESQFRELGVYPLKLTNSANMAENR